MIMEKDKPVPATMGPSDIPPPPSYQPDGPNLSLIPSQTGTSTSTRSDPATTASPSAISSSKGKTKAEGAILAILRGVINSRLFYIYPSYVLTMLEASNAADKKLDRIKLAIPGGDSWSSMLVTEDLWDDLYMELKEERLTRRVFMKG